MQRRMPRIARLLLQLNHVQTRRHQAVADLGIRALGNRKQNAFASEDRKQATFDLIERRRNFLRASQQRVQFR